MEQEKKMQDKLGGEMTDKDVKVTETSEETDAFTAKEENPESESSTEAEAVSDIDSDKEKELQEIKAKLEEQIKKSDDYFNRMQRLAAEFDNYKKRTAREKESLYLEVVAEVVAAFLPVADNLDRALKAASESSDQPLKEGVELVHKQMKDVLKSLEVEEIKSVGEKFNPDLHNAVMHVTDDSVGENIIVEEFQKGYIVKDKVIRYSMVKVAN